MPKVHNIGKEHFVQLFRFPADWGNKFVVRGETHETSYPFRASTPLMIRLPFYRVLVIGKWVETNMDEETALHTAIQGRVLKDEDFQEGWEPPAYQAPKKGREYTDY